MAYKNQSKNKKHIAKLKKDSDGWRAEKRKKRNAMKPPKPEMSMAEMERVISRF